MSVPARQRISSLRNKLHDIASDLDGEGIQQDGQARTEIDRAAANVRKAISLLTDALACRLDD